MPSQPPTTPNGSRARATGPRVGASCFHRVLRCVAAIAVVTVSVTACTGEGGNGEQTVGPSTGSVVVPAPTAADTSVLFADPTTPAIPPTTPAASTVTVTVTAPSSTAPTRTATSTTEPAAGGLLALDVLALIPVELEHRGGYDRDLFGYPADLDGDGCDTRDEVLIDESLTPAQIDPVGCTVVTGDWSSSYDGLTTTSPADLQIDHVVALTEAWDSGAWAWSPQRRNEYSNDMSDPRTLAAVSSTSNQAKGDRDPSNWIPRPDDVCRYISDWVSIKARWSLAMDQSEWGRIKNLLQGPCVGTTVTPWSEPLSG